MSGEQTARVSATIEFLETGVPNLDLVLGGGFPRGAIGIVVGPPGSGKTMLGQQMSYHRARQGENVLYLTGYAETHDKLIAHSSNLLFVDRRFLGNAIQLGSLPPLLEAGADEAVRGVVRTARQHQSRLVVIDGFRSLRRLIAVDGGSELPNAARFIYDLGAQLAMVGATTLILMEGDPDDGLNFSELTVADAVIGLRRSFHGSRQRRVLDVRKVRGAAPLDGLHPYALTASGFELWPRFESGVLPSAPPFTKGRASFGIESIDTLLGGGLPASTTTLAAGSPGTGKTLLGLHFLAEGARLSEPGLYVGFMESAAQLHEKARVFGLASLMDAPAQQAGRPVRIASLPGHDLEADRIADLVREDIDRRGTRRVVVDSVGHLQRSLGDADREGDLFAALVSFFRDRSVTAYLPYEIPKVVGQELDFGDMPLAALAENLLLLRHVEVRGQLARIFSILKMRFSDFDPTIRELTIVPERGVVMKEPIPFAEGMLTGIARISGAAPQSFDGPTRTTASPA